MALIPPFFLDCVVAIGVGDDEGNCQWIASGFLYGHFLRKIDKDNNEYCLYLVTNRHVLAGQKLVYLRFNPVGTSPAQEYSVDLGAADGSCQAFFHPDPEIDLAVVPLDHQVLLADNIQFSYFLSDCHIAAGKDLEEMGMSEGDFVYVLGFPMGIVGEKRSFVIVRQGTIARIRDYLAGAGKEILIDCLVFPGNSGGPVVTKPENLAIDGTKYSDTAYLIGVVASFIPYEEEDDSPQAGKGSSRGSESRDRMKFEDNSGLSYMVPLQYLVELIESLQG